MGRRRTNTILLVVALFLAAAVAAEAFLRAFEPGVNLDKPYIRAQLGKQENIRHAPFVPDPDLGALMAPSQQIRVETLDYSYTLRTDHAGFPNLDPWPERADIAVLGNSLITGADVGYEGQFTTLLQQRLGGQTVLNFGIPGGGTEHQLRAYRKFAAPLHPRLVIATLWLTWEIDNSMKFADWLSEDPRPDFTEYRFAYGNADQPKDREKPARRDRKPGPLISLLDRSRLLRAIHVRSRSLRGIRDPVEWVVLDDGEVLYLSARDEARLMQGWSRPGKPDLRGMFFGPLEELKAEVEADGGKFLVVLFPCKEEIYAAEAFPELLKPVQVARAELKARGIQTLDLYPLFDRIGTTRQAFHRTDIHPNAYGHQVVTDALAEEIAKQGIFSPAP